MRDDLQINDDFTYSNYQAEELVVFPTTVVSGGSGSPVLTINGVVTGPSVTFSGGSSGFSYTAVGTTTLNLVSPLTTKGDVYGHTGAAGTRLAVGANGTVLTADSTQATGLRWATAAAGTVTSFSATPAGIFDVANATTTPALSLDNQNANIVLAGPSSGGAATPAFRALVDDDIPAALTISGGTIENTPVGATTAGTGRFTTVNSTSSSFLSNGTQVVGAQGAAVADATGGGTVDTEARAAINTLLARLRAHGLIVT